VISDILSLEANMWWERANLIESVKVKFGRGVHYLDPTWQGYVAFVM
jgi:hypothetical protein